MYRLTRTKQGQAVLEYVIVLTAIVATFVMVAESLKTKLNYSLENVTTNATALVGEVDFH